MHRIDHPCAEAWRISSSIERTLPACSCALGTGRNFVLTIFLAKISKATTKTRADHHHMLSRHTYASIYQTHAHTQDYQILPSMHGCEKILVHEGGDGKEEGQREFSSRAEDTRSKLEGSARWSCRSVLLQRRGGPSCAFFPRRVSQFNSVIDKERKFISN